MVKRKQTTKEKYKKKSKIVKKCELLNMIIIHAISTYINGLC